MTQILSYSVLYRGQEITLCDIGCRCSDCELEVYNADKIAEEPHKPERILSVTIRDGGTLISLCNLNCHCDDCEKTRLGI